MKKTTLLTLMLFVLFSCKKDDESPTLNAPTATDATDITDDIFVANWMAVTDATGYDVQVSTSNAFSSIAFQQTDVPTTTTGFSGLEQNTQYYYRVSAHVNGGRRSDYSNTIGVITLPSPPIATDATNITTSSFVANWETVERVDTYLLYVSTGMPAGLGGDILPAYNGIEVTGSSLEVTGLEFNTVYYYQLRSKVENRVSTYSNAQNALTL